LIKILIPELKFQGHDINSNQQNELDFTGNFQVKPQAIATQKGLYMGETIYEIKPIGVTRSELASREAAPRQGYEGAPDAWVEVSSALAVGLEGISVGSEIILITWLHKAHRDILKLHPRGDKSNPMTGVFSTRSPDRPNPLGLHRVTVLEITGYRLKVGPIEAIDGTPVVDIKPVLLNTVDL
jgi:tRNA-Thr(GGU) m(6)t(6)A37 methyltransferase TsaA